MTGGRLNQFNITKQSKDYDEVSCPPRCAILSRWHSRARSVMPCMVCKQAFAPCSASTFNMQCHPGGILTTSVVMLTLVEARCYVILTSGWRFQRLH